MSVRVQSLAIATIYIKKQVCLRYYVEAYEALFLKSAVAAVQSPAGDISYMLKFFRQYVGLQVREDRIHLVFWIRDQSGPCAAGSTTPQRGLQWDKSRVCVLVQI